MDGSDYLATREGEGEKHGEANHDIRGADALTLAGVAVAAAYMATRRCQLGHAEFLALLSFLALVLAFAISVQDGRRRGEREPFDVASLTASDAYRALQSMHFSQPSLRVPALEGFASTAQGQRQSATSFAPGLQVLYSMPGRVRAALVPPLEHVANTFSGSNQTGPNAPSHLVRLAESNVYLTPKEHAEDAAEQRAAGGTLVHGGSNLNRVRNDMRYLDALLCRLKHADPNLYARVLDTSSWMTTPRQ